MSSTTQNYEERWRETFGHTSSPDFDLDDMKEAKETIDDFLDTNGIPDAIIHDWDTVTTSIGYSALESVADAVSTFQLWDMTYRRKELINKLRDIQDSFDNKGQALCFETRAKLHNI